MTLTKLEIAALMPIIDAGIKTVGVHVFQNGGGLHIHTALIKFQALVSAADEPVETVEE